MCAVTVGESHVLCPDMVMCALPFDWPVNIAEWLGVMYVRAYVSCSQALCDVVVRVLYTSNEGSCSN